MAAPNKQFPKDGLVIISMMKELGITSYEPRVVNQMMEFAIRYVSCVLDDARALANHSSNRKLIDSEDVKLAVMMQLEKVFTTPPPRDLLLEVARSKNSVPLPLVKPHCGIRLPPDRYCFSACNYKLKSNAKPEKIQQVDKKGKFGIGSSSNVSGSIKVSKGPSNVSVVKRPPNVSNIARAQPPTPAAVKPVLKVVESYGGEWVMSGQSPVAKAMIQVPGQQSVEVKIEPQDSPSDANPNKRKREDE